MNDTHVQQIFANYIDKFNVMNNFEHCEYFKWQIANSFRRMMDEALNGPSCEFSARLKDMRKLSSVLIDNYTQPFYGLCKFAEKEPDTVKEMFTRLYMDDGGDIRARQNRIQEFLKDSHGLREKYSPDSYLYKDDMHSVTSYLFLYDPDHNYIFKATHALRFADCVEFYDDWGMGENVKLDVYYRMCDQLVEKIKQDELLMKTDARRFSGELGVNSETLYPDFEKHVLAFDIIYCCKTYDLFSGITFNSPKGSVRAKWPMLKQKAKELYEDVLSAREKVQKLGNAKEYIDSMYLLGTELVHKNYGKGVIRDKNETTLIIDFPNVGTKKIGTYIASAKGVISLELEEYAVRLDACKEYLMNEDKIRIGLISAEKEFEPYAKYLD